MTTNAELRALMVIAESLPRVAKALERIAANLEERPIHEP